MDEKIEKYLQRIGYTGSTVTTRETLAAVLTCHLQSVPYENLDILAGVPLRLDADALFDKIVTRRRGGFCFELNAAFGILLRGMGYDVTDCFARYLMGEEGIPMRRHHVLMVRLGGEKWLCDVGVGNEAPRKPLVLREGVEQTDGMTAYRFETDAYLGWVLCQKHGDEWRRQYAFTEEPQISADFAAATFYCEKHPDSIFNKEKMIAIKTPDGRRTIDGNVYKVFGASGVTAETIETDARMREVLKTQFGIGVKQNIRRVLSGLFILVVVLLLAACTKKSDISTLSPIDSDNPLTMNDISAEVSTESSIQGLDDKTTIGDVITFGDYEWLVLDVQNDKVLIITKDVVDIRTYYNGFDDTCWEASDLRAYLNGGFYEEFSAASKRRIIETEINTPNNPWFDTDGGVDTFDRIFLLSLQEVVEYFGDSGSKDTWDGSAYLISDEYNANRQAKLRLSDAQIEKIAELIDKSPTFGDEYSRKEALDYVREANDGFWWWRLRSPGRNNSLVVRIQNDGAIQVSGYYASNDYVDVDVYGDNVHTVLGGVRPAMWVSK